MKVQILTIFPEIFKSFLETSLIKTAIERDLLAVTATNIRTFAAPPHNKVDDTPYGGGAGMTMKPEPLYDAVQHAKKLLPKAKVYLLSPRGERFSQAKAEALSKDPEAILICGRYEGVDERVVELCVDEEISIGDFVLMGGEVAVMAILEATTRLIPGVVGNSESIASESFCGKHKLLESPQYTRPPEFLGKKVPDVLLSGNHEQIAKWRMEQSVAITKIRRPDLIKP